MSFIDAVKARRSIYGFTGEKLLSNEELENLIKDLVLNMPTAFNSQSSRVILLFDDKHRSFWDMVTAAIRKAVEDDAAFEQSKQKIENAFKSGYATALFYEDIFVVNNLGESFPTYAKNFPIWSQHSNAMLQFAVWTALAEKGLGASLQHYNELIENSIAKELSIPDNWRLVAQMPIGKPAAPAGPKEFADVNTRVLTYK